MQTTSETTTELHRERNFTFFALLLIILLAAVLRFYQIDSESFWTDEAFTAILAEKDLNTLVDELAQTGRPPAMILLAHFWTQIFGHSDLAARSLLAVAGVLCVPLIYLIASRLFNQIIGLTSAFFLAIGYMHIFYSQEYRYYGILSLFTLLAAYFYILALETQKWRDYLLFAVFSILMVYTHFLSAFVVAAWGLHFLYQWLKNRNNFTRWLVSQVVIAAAILPVFYIQYLHLADEADEAGTVLLEAATTTPSFYTPIQTIYRFLFGRGIFSDLQLRLVILVLGVAAVGVFAFMNRKSWLLAVKSLPQNAGRLLKTQTSPLLLVTLWLIVPILFLFLMSVLVTPLYFERYVIGAAPGFYILLSVILYELRKVVPLIISLAIITSFAVPSLLEYYSEIGEPDWKKAAAYITDHIQPDEGLTVNVYGVSFYWYYRNDINHCYIDSSPEEPYPTSTFPGWEPTADVEKYNHCDRLWVVLRNPIPGRIEDIGIQKNEEFTQAIAREGYVAIEEVPFNKLTVYLYEKQVGA